VARGASATKASDTEIAAILALWSTQHGDMYLVHDTKVSRAEKSGKSKPRGGEEGQPGCTPPCAEPGLLRECASE
jgi:hypothetical protein